MPHRILEIHYTENLADLVRQINAALAHIQNLEEEVRGERGTYAFASSVDVNGFRVQHLARTRSGTDAINRDETQSLIDAALRDRLRRLRFNLATLTDNTGGTADGTLVDVAGGDTVSEAAVENNFADLAQRVNNIITFLRQLLTILTEDIPRAPRA